MWYVVWFALTSRISLRALQWFCCSSYAAAQPPSLCIPLATPNDPSASYRRLSLGHCRVLVCILRLSYLVSSSSALNGLTRRCNKPLPDSALLDENTAIGNHARYSSCYPYVSSHMTPEASLYRVNRHTASWTLVVASSEEHAKIIARKLSHETFVEEKVRCSATEIRSVRAIPDDWKGGLPWFDPSRQHLYEDVTCEDVIQYARSKKLLGFTNPPTSRTFFSSFADLGHR